MSANASGQVWKHSRAKGSNLLVLLAIADIADEQGRNAWPSPEHLAEKTRMTPRAMRLILHRLERDGELVIELNADRRPVRTGHVPLWFLHVRCVADPEAYARAESEKFSETPFPEGRRATGKLFPIAAAVNRKTFPANRKNHVRQPEKSRTAYKEDPSVDPLVELKAGAPPLAPATDNLNLVTKIAHEAIDQFGIDADLGALTDTVKSLCALRAIAYYPPYDLVRRAVDSALWQRRQRQAAR